MTAIILLLSIFMVLCCDKSKNFYADKTMVCLGDSLTSGFGIAHAYPERVKDLLGLKDVYNYGIPGSTISDVEGKFPFINRYNDMPDADIVAVLFAGNDASFYVELGDIDSFDNKTIYGALNILINGLIEKYPNSYIFFITPFYNISAPVIEPLVIATRNVCVKYNIDLLDNYYAEANYNSERDTIDGVHLNQKFTDNIWSKQIAQFIEEKYHH